jgi:hypothetical protein
MSLMKSLPMMARTEVLQRNITEDWSVKDQTSCKENLHLGREDDIVKIVQMEGTKCINTWGPMGAKGRSSRAGMGLGRLAQAGRPGPLRGSVRPPFSCTRRSFNPKLLEVPPFARQRAIRPRGHPQAKEKRRGSFARRIAQLEGSAHKWRRRKTPSEASPWSTVPYLAPWWGNLLIWPWVVIKLEDVIATLFGYLSII